MAYTMFSLTVLQALFYFFAWSSADSKISFFRCATTTQGSRVSSVVLKNGSDRSNTPTAVNVSLAACSVLCARTPFNACQSYAYDPATQRCYTGNTTLNRSGYLCGMSTEKILGRCQPGHGVISYSGNGNNRTMTECVCGGYKYNSSLASLPASSGNWINNCTNACTNKYSCTTFSSSTENCRVCSNTLEICLTAITYEISGLVCTAFNSTSVNLPAV